MVKRIEKLGKIYYQCEVCDMLYKTKEFAEKCEAFCKKYNACNTELIKHAIIFN